MASKRFKGGAGYVAQVSTLTVGGTPALGQIYTVTIGLNSIAYTASGIDTNSTIAAALQVLLAASTLGEFSGITWTVNAAVITGTARTAGTPFTATTSATGTGTFVTATTTANVSPNAWGNALNWDTGAVPVNGDDVYLDQTSFDIWWDLDQSAVTLASLTITSTFQKGDNGDGQLGLPEVNASGSKSYVEYRTTFLKIGATTCTIGDGLGNGSDLLKIDFGSVQTSCTVHSTGTGPGGDLEALQLKGTHASNVFSIISGSVALAPFGGDSSVAATVNIGSSGSGAPSVRTGPNCSITTLNMEDGSVLLGKAPTTVNKVGGDLTVLTGTFTTLNERGGTTAYLGTGGLGTVVVGGDGTLDLTQDVRARSLTAITLYAGASLLDRFRTLGNFAFTLAQCGIEDVTLELGKNLTIGVTDL
jgi:hypothetical protein